MPHRLYPIWGTKRSKRVPAIAALFFVCHTLSSYGQQTVDVIAQNYRFQPQEVRIHPGDSVRWLNHEKRTSHSIVFSDAGGGESERFFPDESWQRRFDIAGIYSYHCGPHPEMTGKVVVQASSPIVSCDKVAVPNEWKISVGMDKGSVEIVQGNGPIKRLTLRPDLLPEVHYLSRNHHALLATRDGWILRLDLERAQLIAETKLNAVVSSTALSAPQLNQEQLLAVATNTPGTLTILNESLHVLKTIPVIDKAGHITSGLLSIQTAESRDSFITLLADTPELWEVSYNPKAPEIGLGMVHDFQYREGHFVPGYLNPQRSALPSLAQDFVLLDSGHEVLTVHGQKSAMSASGSVRMYVMHLDVRKTETVSPPRFLPDVPNQNWLQVDPSTLPKNTIERVLRVTKPTLHFSDFLRNPERQAASPKSASQACVEQP